MRKGLPDVPDEYKRRGVFIAKWGGRCGVCQDEFYPGDECHYVDDEVAHEDCE